MADNHRLLELAKDGDRDARDKLVTDNMGLVVSVARRYVGRGQELEDLIQIGLIGLVKAIDRFDMDYEVKNYQRMRFHSFKGRLDAFSGMTEW